MACALITIWFLVAISVFIVCPIALVTVICAPTSILSIVNKVLAGFGKTLILKNNKIYITKYLNPLLMKFGHFVSQQI